MATSPSIQSKLSGDRQSQSAPHKSPGATFGVDTSAYREGYAAQSSAFTFYQVKEARHVDARPLGDSRRGRTYRAQLRPIKWDEYLGAQAAEEFSKHHDPASLTWKEVVPHVALMLERLRFQKLHYKAGGPSPEKMVYDCLAMGPAFTAQWASGWKESRFKWCNTERTEAETEVSRKVDFKDYNSTIPPFFFIFWQDEVEDYKWMNMGKPHVDPETLEHLQKTVSDLSEELLPNGLPEIPLEEEFLPVSSNGYYGDGESKPEWELEYDYPWTDEEVTGLSYLRSQALKRPSETRDIGMHTPGSMRLHRRIMFPMKAACRKIPGCPYGKGQDEVRKTVQHLGDGYRHFFMRDYTKSGMTMPHEVRSAVIRGFYARQPDLAEKYVRAFNRQVLFVRKEDSVVGISPDTGTPLGMFVEGFTLFGYAVDRMIQQTMQSSIKYSCVNDDMIAAAKTYDAIRAYADQDSDIQRDLGMLVKGSKSGITEDKFFYCEEYWDGEKLLSKEVLAALTILGARFAINVVHAKELVNSITLGLPYFSKVVRHAVKMVQESYDFEFSDQEVNWPYLFGGWLPCYRDGLDCSIEWRNGDGIADVAYWACRERISKKRELGHDPSLAYSRKKDLRLLDIPEDELFYNKLVPLFGKKKALSDMFSLISRNPRDLRRYYEQLYWKRLHYFQGALKGRHEIPSVTHGWLRRHPNSVIVKGLEGVKYCEPIAWVNQPRIGLSPWIRDWELREMAHRGLIQYPGAEKISLSVLKCTVLGYSKEVQYDRVAMGKGGISRFILQNHLRGLEKFQEDTGLAISTVDEEDTQETITEHWIEMNLPLQWLIRVDKTSRTTPYPLSESTRLFWHQLVNDRYQLHGFDPEVDREETKREYLSTFEEDFITYIRSLLDGETAEIRAQIIPKQFAFAFGIEHPTVEDRDPPPEGYYWNQQGELLPVDPESVIDYWDKSDSDGEVAAGWDF